MNNELLKQCKEKVAKKNGFKDWAECQRVWLDRVGQVLVVHENYIEQVAELYAPESLEAYNRECKRADELTEEVAMLQSRLKSEYERGYNQGMVEAAKEL